MFITLVQHNIIVLGSLHQATKVRLFLLSRLQNVYILWGGGGDLKKAGKLNFFLVRLNWCGPGERFYLLLNICTCLKCLTYNQKYIYAYLKKRTQLSYLEFISCERFQNVCYSCKFPSRSYWISQKQINRLSTFKNHLN